MIFFVLTGIILALLNIILIKKEHIAKAWIYFTAEIVLNIVFVVTTIFTQDISAKCFFEVFVINMLIYLAVCDIKEMYLPIIAFAVFAIVGVFSTFFGTIYTFLYNIIFALLIFGTLLLASKKSNEAIGKGDVYALSCIALFESITDFMSIVMMSLLFSLIYGIIYSIIRKSGMKTMVAYMPFLGFTYYLIKLIY